MCGWIDVLLEARFHFLSCLLIVRPLLLWVGPDQVAPVDSCNVVASAGRIGFAVEKEAVRFGRIQRQKRATMVCGCNLRIVGTLLL
jgi:hypothetical protein